MQSVPASRLKTVSPRLRTCAGKGSPQMFARVIASPHKSHHGDNLDHYHHKNQLIAVSPYALATMNPMAMVAQTHQSTQWITALLTISGTL